MPRYTIKDLLLATTLVAIGAGTWAFLFRGVVVTSRMGADTMMLWIVGGAFIGAGLVTPLERLVGGGHRCNRASVSACSCVTAGPDREAAVTISRLAMRRFLKYLRITVFATSLIACVLLIALWVRSYWRLDAA